MHAEEEPNQKPRRPRVLLAEDDAPLRKVMAHVLADAGMEVSPVGHGGEAIELVRARDFDVALVDVVLPGIGGIELVRRIRELRPALPVLIASGHAGLFREAGLEKLGVRRVLTKPFQLAEMLAAVGEACAPYPAPPAGEGQGQAAEEGPAAGGGLSGRDWRELRRRSMGAGEDVPDAAEQRECGER
jgi:CheY-like chemotaxis protein